jgi:hypothetical protein
MDQLSEKIGQLGVEVVEGSKLAAWVDALVSSQQ